MNGWQIALVVLIIWGFICMLSTDLNGTKATKPHGFIGAMVTLSIYGVLVFIFYKAGLFSTLLK